MDIDMHYNLHRCMAGSLFGLDDEDAECGATTYNDLHVKMNEGC